MNDETRAEIGARFKTFRKEEIKLTQKKFAEEAGIHEKTVVWIETGKTMPSHETLSFLSDRYNANIDWIITGKGSKLSTGKVDEGGTSTLQARVSLLENEVKSLRKTLVTVLEKLTKL